MTQTALAEQSKLSQPMINRYVRGQALGVENLARLVAVLPEPHGSRLVAAYLRDSLPPALAHHVAILANNPHVNEDDADAQRLGDLIAALDPELRRDVLFLIGLAGRQTAIADIFRRSAEILRG